MEKENQELFQYDNPATAGFGAGAQAESGQYVSEGAGDAAVAGAPVVFSAAINPMCHSGTSIYMNHDVNPMTVICSRCKAEFKRTPL